MGESVTMADALWTNFYHSILAALESQDLKTVIEEKFPTLNAYFLKGPDRFPYLKTRPPSKLWMFIGNNYKIKSTSLSIKCILASW